MQLPEGFEIVRWNNSYAINQTGTVLSNRQGKRWRQLKLCYDREGYAHVRVGKQKRPVHRLVALQYIPNIDNKPQVAHIDGNKLNNVVGNLRWSTQQENIQDRERHGTTQRGERHYRAKLNRAKVSVIKHLLKTKDLTQKEIGKLFGVNQSTINYIKLRGTWRHI